MNPQIQNLDKCPVCAFQWKGQDILEYFKEQREAGHPSFVDKDDDDLMGAAGLFGWSKENPTYFKNLVGLEIPGKYDGVSYWTCPECRNVWDRFTEEILDERSRVEILTFCGREP